MTAPLNAHQVEALRAYADLIATRKDLFEGRRRRPIVRDPATLEHYAAEHDVVLGVAAKTPYLWLVNDLVASATAAGQTTLHPYLRIVQPEGLIGVVGVVVIATLGVDDGGPERVVVVRQERHATGRVEVELPRGFGTVGVGPEVDAVRELAEETGYAGVAAEVLGTTLTDSGTSDGLVSFVHVRITGRATSSPEISEAIERVVLMTRDELWQRIDSGAVRDSFTLQAVSLYERSLTRPGR